MFRKLAIVLVAVAALSSPSFAFGGGHLGGVGSHFGGGHFAGGLGRLLHGGHFHGGFFRDGFDDMSDSCYRTVFTDFGPRRVFVCD
jgi:hypothetical protein